MGKAERAGRRLISSFSYLLTALFIYVVLCLVTYVILMGSLGWEQGASFITFEIATGGDPYNFKEIAINHPVVWVWMLGLHVASWLMVPLLAATAIDAAYRTWEERRRVLDMELRREMSRILEEHVTGISKDDAERIAERFLEESNAKLANKGRRE